MGSNGFNQIRSLYLFSMVLGIRSFNLRDFDLPGIFSKDICSMDEISRKLSPLCHCRNQTEITDIYSLCKSYVKFGNCIDANIEKNKQDGLFLQHVFSNEKFKHNMAYLCGIKSDAAGIAECTVPNIPIICNNVFEQYLNKTTFYNESTACSIVQNSLRECYWDIYKSSCPPKVRYFWSKLSESFLSIKCSKYGRSKTDRCIKIRNAFHPNSVKRKQQSEMDCYESVKTMRRCFQMERLDSLHHEDIWNQMEFELDRFMRYERFRCDFQKEKDKNHHCEHPHRKSLEHCINGIYGKGFERQTKMLKTGGTVTMNETCRIYEDTTRCIEKALRDCIINGAHINAIFCGSMPSSCHCPVNIASLSSSNTVTPSTWILLFIYVCKDILQKVF